MEYNIVRCEKDDFQTTDVASEHLMPPPGKKMGNPSRCPYCGRFMKIIGKTDKAHEAGQPDQ